MNRRTFLQSVTVGVAALIGIKDRIPASLSTFARNKWHYITLWHHVNEVGEWERVLTIDEMEALRENGKNFTFPFDT